ncbi:MAG TPA: hypothetical protein VGO35_01670 [Gammaproteobacteria bacterium]|nr:hypothetical protein [Gammaproteobacteria bacterium]
MRRIWTIIGVRDAALAVIESASDWNDVLDDTTSVAEAERNLDELLADLHHQQGRLFYYREPHPFGTDRQRQPILLDTICFVVYPSSSPMILKEEGREVAVIR